jgi:hypothetical protein
MASGDGGANLGCLVILVGLGGVIWLADAWRDGQVQGKWLLWRDCPFGTELAGKHPPDGNMEWCQEKDDQGGYRKHGPIHVWYPSGRIKGSNTTFTGTLDDRGGCGTRRGLHTPPEREVMRGPSTRTRAH